MPARVIIHSHCPIELRGSVCQINMEYARQGLAFAHVEGFYEDADFYGIQMWIDAFMTMENAPMPSAVLFKSPVSDTMVGFVVLCMHLEGLFMQKEQEREEYEMHDVDLDAESLNFSVDTFYLSDDDSFYAPGSPRSVMDF